MSIEIKVLRSGEENVLERVASGVFDNPINLERTRECLSDARHHIIVAVEHEQVIGFVSGVHYVHPDKPSPEMWLNEIGVAPTHHRRGVAKTLLHSLLDVSRKLHCTEMWVLTERENTAAMRLYAAAGGQEAAVELAMFSFRLDD